MINCGRSALGAVHLTVEKNGYENCNAQGPKLRMGESWIREVVLEPKPNRITKERLNSDMILWKVSDGIGQLPCTYNSSVLKFQHVSEGILDGKYVAAVVGDVNAGKSCFINNCFTAFGDSVAHGIITSPHKQRTPSGNHLLSPSPSEQWTLREVPFESFPNLVNEIDCLIWIRKRSDYGDNRFVAECKRKGIPTRALDKDSILDFEDKSYEKDLEIGLLFLDFQEELRKIGIFSFLKSFIFQANNFFHSIFKTKKF